jgi:hypothetical protein
MINIDGIKIYEFLTKEQRMELLYKAKILDKDGNYHPDFFSEETIRRSKEANRIKE